MGKSPTGKNPLSGMFGKAVDGLKSLPNPTRLPGFFPLTLVLVLVVLPSDVLKAYPWLTLLVCVLALITYYAFSVWVHRPNTSESSFPTPPFAVVDAAILRELAAQPTVLLLALGAASEALRTQIRTLAEQVRRRKVNNSEGDVWERLGQVLDQPELVVRALLAWAEQNP